MRESGMLCHGRGSQVRTLLLHGNAFLMKGLHLLADGPLSSAPNSFVWVGLRQISMKTENYRSSPRLLQSLHMTSCSNAKNGDTMDTAPCGNWFPKEESIDNKGTGGYSDSVG